MELDELLYHLRQRRLILISADEVWPGAGYTRQIQRAVKRHRRGLALLLQWSSIATCPSPTWHRKYWRYAGQGRYICDVCERIAV